MRGRAGPFFARLWRRRQPSGRTAGHTAAVRLLLEHGASTEAVSTSGTTPLFYAAEFGHYDAVESLLNHGAKVNAKDRQDLTPIDRAAVGGHKQIVELLRMWGATTKKVMKLDSGHESVGNGTLTPMYGLCRSKNGPRSLLMCPSSRHASSAP